MYKYKYFIYKYKTFLLNINKQKLLFCMRLIMINDLKVQKMLYKKISNVWTVTIRPIMIFCSTEEKVSDNWKYGSLAGFVAL